MITIFFPKGWGMSRVRQYRQTRYLEGEYFVESNGQFYLNIKMPPIYKKTKNSGAALPILFAALGGLALSSNLMLPTRIPRIR